MDNARSQQRHEGLASTSQDQIGISMLYHALAQQSPDQARPPDLRVDRVPPHSHPPLVSVATINTQPQQSGTQESGPARRPAPRTLQCQICKRTYERPDHLNRHLRSHENARQFRCIRCSKSFNRADLLRRHMKMHERHMSIPTSQLHIINRTDRTSTACMACVAAKAKCGNEKPCQRCRKKGIDCLTNRQASSGIESDSSTAKDPDASCTPGEQTVANEQEGVESEIAKTGYINSSRNTNLDRDVASSNYASDQIDAFSADSQNQTLQAPLISHNLSQSSLYASNSFEVVSGQGMMNDIFLFPNVSCFTDQESEFGFWNLPSGDFQLPYPSFDANHPKIPQSDEVLRREKPQWNTRRGYAAFKRSPWLWTPTLKDNTIANQTDLALGDDRHTSDLTPSSGVEINDVGTTHYMDGVDRDRMFSLAVSANRSQNPLPGFPSLDILNHLLQVYFVRESYQVDNWVHAPTFDARGSHAHLLMALASAGSTLICGAVIWKMGLAMQEITRIAIGEYWENKNASTRDFQMVRAFLLCIDIGLWSGFKRKMEIAESFAQPLVTMTRRAGVFLSSQEVESLAPGPDDNSEVLETKWQKWVMRESRKRFAIRLFLHCTQASVCFQSSPLLLLPELSFELPESRELWLAKSAADWKTIFLQKCAVPQSTKMRVIDLLDNISLLEVMQNHVDVDLCCTLLLYGFWGQIWSSRESRKFFLRGKQHGYSSSGFWLNLQQSELCKDIEDFFGRISKLKQLPLELQMVKELLMTLLYVSPDELQNFSGKSGEDEAAKATESLKLWVHTEDARKAAWHAGQVLRSGRLLAPAELRGFYAIAVYLASLTLWVFGHMTNSSSPTEDDGPPQPEMLQSNTSQNHTSQVLLDGPENRETRMFLSFNQGRPGLSAVNGNHQLCFESLEDPNIVFRIACQIYRGNFPVVEEKLPPLLENLEKLMRDLGSRSDSRHSESVSEEDQG